MKTKIFSVLFFSLVLSTSIFAGYPPIVPGKILNSFKSSFPEVKNESWHELKNTYEVTFFASPKVRCRIFYSPDGSILETFKYYYKEGLPLFIRTKLGKEYNGKEVIGVTEVYRNGKTTYDIMLRDNINLFEVTVNQYGSMRLKKKLTRYN